MAAVAVAAAVVPISPRLVERAYSTRVFPAMQRALTTASNRVPFAVLDAAVVLVVCLWIVFTLREFRRAALLRVQRAPQFGRALVIVLTRTIVWAAAAYLAFLATWGLNYRRTRLADRVEFRAEAITPEAARSIARAVVHEVNTSYQPAHDAGFAPAGAIDPVLARSFAAAVAATGSGAGVVVGRPKRTLLDWYFRRAAVSGMTDPFFLETLVASDVLPFERPAVVAHEWSHLAGVADEGEANFIAWLACVYGSAAHRYSGWLFLYQEVLPTLRRDDRAHAAAALDAGPRADLQASRERYLRNVSPRVASAGWRMYDSYLRANRVEAGAASYAEVVRLVLGVQFTGEWQPVLKER